MELISWTCKSRRKFVKSLVLLMPQKKKKKSQYGAEPPKQRA